MVKRRPVMYIAEYCIGCILSTTTCLVCDNLSMTDGYGEFVKRLLRYSSNWPLDAVCIQPFALFFFLSVLIRALLNWRMICIPTHEFARPSMGCTKKNMYATSVSRKRAG